MCRSLAHRPAACATFFLATGCLLAAENYTPGPQVLTFHSDIDDSEQPYALYLPETFDPAQQYPLVISLHGADENHRLNLRRVFGRGIIARETEGETASRFPQLPDVEFIVACPLARGDMGYQGIPEKDVYDVLADVKRRFRVDEDRVYLTGLAAGGAGALWLGLTHPDLWAAIAPVCPTPLAGAEELAPNALNVPVHLFHGEQDPVAPVEVPRKWHKRFLELGVHSEYVEYPAVRHNAWDYAYRDRAIFAWFAKFKRNPYPERVRYVTRAYRYAGAWWVRLDRLTPGEPASIDARFTGPNRIEIHTAGTDGFTLQLAGHPQFHVAAPLSVTVDGVALRPKGRASFSFTKAEQGWTLGAAGFLPEGVKRPGAEGPIAAAVAARHIYVYGTSDAPGERETIRRREVATAASQWSTARARLQLSFAVKADQDVTEKDLAEDNLVLFGTKETNSLIARFARHFPLELNAGAADYGLVLVAPVGRHYALVNSGRAWWTGADQSRRIDWRLSPAPYRVLASFGDYIFFKGSLDHVVAEGRFDRNWKVPAAPAEKMRETGAVVIR